MAQPSVANYFNTRKRTNLENLKVTRARKVLLLENEGELKGLSNAKKAIFSENIDKLDVEESVSGKIVVINNNEPQITAKKTARAAKPKKLPNQRDIQEVFNNMTKNVDETVINDKIDVDPVEMLKTPPASPVKKANAMDKVKINGKELNFSEIKQKLSRSSRLAELKASMARLKEGAAKLEKIEAKTSKIPDSPSLKAFKSIELEVMLSPKKLLTPENAYLSPKKDSTARRNLLHLLSPTKNAVAVPASPSKQLFSPQKASLTLPYKYRTLAEMFRSIDIVCQIMHNRKETITFTKLKPAVEELLKRNLHEKHLAQIKTLYPDAFIFKQEKLRVYGTGTKLEQWELVVEPVLDKEAMGSDCLLERRRKLFGILIEKVKFYHKEFLSNLDPPMVIANDKITRWHPEFDIERVPDVDSSALPQPPVEEKFTTGKDVLEKARSMFNCNSRMEQALERLKKAQETQTTILPETKPVETPTILKGVPKALLERIRQKQAAKALMSMTRSDEKEKELELYSRLPELARLIRNLYVAEKKSVLPIDTVLAKLGNSLRTFMTKTDLELHLKTLEKEVPGWLVFHNIRNCDFIKISKNADLSLVINKLDKLIKEKTVC